MRIELIALLGCALISSCGTVSSEEPVVTATPPIETVVEPRFSTVHINQSTPHSPTSYTQGLLIHDGKLYESTGQYGSSKLLISDIESGKIEREVALAADYFGEGLAILDDKLYQLTWMEGKCLVYDANSLKLLETLTYEGQGWGIVAYNDKLLMSNGSSTITVRDPKTFKALSSFEVKDNRGSVTMVNEMEIINSMLYANIYMSPLIVVINPENGEVVEYIDCSKLYKELQNGADADVLNGIAYDKATKKTYLTGKLWDKLFEVSI